MVNPVMELTGDANVFFNWKKSGGIICLGVVINDVTQFRRIFDPPQTPSRRHAFYY
jgi:hypothetical protein